MHPTLEGNYKLAPFVSERFLVTGVVSSPNFPDRPPSNLDKEYTIEVEQGLVLRLEFTEFDLDYGWGYNEKEGKYGYVCDGYSHLTIIDGDGTTFILKVLLTHRIM